jgi:hypothetical protein
MATNRYNRTFVNQFREEQILHPGTAERQVDYIKFSHYSGNEQEVAMMAAHLTTLVHDVPLINRLTTTIQDEAIANATRLIDYIQDVKKQFDNYADAEPYTATYYHHLILALSDLEELAETFQNDTREHLLDKLQTAFAVAPGSYLDIDSDIICKIDNVIEFYLDNFEAYDNYFNGLIREEEKQEKAVTVTSQVAWYLSAVVSFTDTFLQQLQTTREILFEWDIQLNNREMQELFN